MALRARDAPVPAPPPPEAAAASAPLPPGHHALGSSSFAVALFLLLALGALPALALAGVESARAHLLLFVGELLLAAAALEWTWLAFRVRRKLLFTLRATDAPPSLPEPESESCLQLPTDAREPELQENRDRDARIPVAALLRRRQQAMRPDRCAVSGLAGRWYVVAFGIAAVGSAVMLAVVCALERAVFRSDKHAIGWQMLVAVTVVGIFLALFLGCLAPSKLDTFVIVVYMSCYIASSMNTFLMFHARAIGELELIDPLYILLVGACAVVVARIITSKFVMESLLQLLFDLLGLVLLAAPMLAAADFVDHPGAEKNRDKLALFLVVVIASETGHWLTKALSARWPQRPSRLLVLPLCRRYCDEAPAQTALKVEVASRSELEAFAGAVMLGALMLPLSLVWARNNSLGVAEALVLVLAIVLGQWSRFFLTSMKHMAGVVTTGFYLPADSPVGGVLDRLAVFLVAAIVYHPYVKHIYFK